MSIAAKRRVQRPIAVGLLSLSCVLLTGCGADPVPSGDQLYGEAESTYLEYRELVNQLQIELHDGPWQIVQLGSYGMQPSRCDGEDGYSFRLHRYVQLDGTQREDYADITQKFLENKGLSPARGVIGTDDQEGQVIQVAIREESGFSMLLVEFLKNGSIGITAETTCHPGDARELSKMLFDGENLGLGYLPIDVEAPTAPLFFGITPGDPQFVGETPAPTPSP